MAQITWIGEWRVVSGRPLDAGGPYSTRVTASPAGGKLFRWTLAGRAKFLDYSLNRP
jgi:hypothetical protein